MASILDEIQQIVDHAYPLIQKYYGKGSNPIPPIELHRDIYGNLTHQVQIKMCEKRYNKSTKTFYAQTTPVIHEIQI